LFATDSYLDPPLVKCCRPRIAVGNPPSAANAARIIDKAWATDAEWGTFVWLTMVTGARRGELVALRFSSVELSCGECGRSVGWLNDKCRTCGSDLAGSRTATLELHRNYSARKKDEKDTKTHQIRRISLDGAQRGSPRPATRPWMADSNAVERHGRERVKGWIVAAEGSTRAVVTALGANVGIAVSKFVAAAITGSASMLAEGVHSVADSGNQVLLLIGGRRARQAPSALHPFGYARARYIYAQPVAGLGRGHVDAGGTSAEAEQRASPLRCRRQLPGRVNPGPVAAAGPRARPRAG
jgi:hypothetical protein